jgi:integrase
MIAYVIKRKGARTYDARIRLGDEKRITQVPLGCTNRQVAEKKLRELLDEKEREAAGLIAPKVERDAANKLLSAHLDDWIAAKERLRDDQYVAGVRGRVLRLIEQCGWRYARDVKAEDYTRWRTGSKLSPKTLNDFLTSMRSVLNWMVKQGRIGFNPLRSLDLLPARDEKRRPRRALTDEEASRLVDGSGERGLAYLVALTTGMRLGELQQVEVRDIRLDDPSPKIAARAATTKNRKDAALPLHPGVAERLRAFLAGRNLDAEDKAFEPLLRPRRQFKRDLEAVGIPSKDAEGRIVDFHSLRYTFCTNLQRLNVPQRVLMMLMRHSDRRLSDHIYTDTSLLPADETAMPAPHTAAKGTPSRLRWWGSTANRSRKPITKCCTSPVPVNGKTSVTTWRARRRSLLTPATFRAIGRLRSTWRTNPVGGGIFNGCSNANRPSPFPSTRSDSSLCAGLPNSPDSSRKLSTSARR